MEKQAQSKRLRWGYVGLNIFLCPVLSVQGNWGDSKHSKVFRIVQPIGTTQNFLVTMRLWETLVPIPNTAVKTQAVEGTWLVTAWESRRLPDSTEMVRGRRKSRVPKIFDFGMQMNSAYAHLFPFAKTLFSRAKEELPI